MAAQHTPGPWILARRDEQFVYALNEQGYNRFWAHVRGGNTGPGEHTTEEELEANARLIANSPELLEVVVRLSAQATRLRLPGQSVTDAEKAALAVIEKITGATP